ncbi:MAG TPA: hypothetical protein VGM32_10830 [Rhodopila sp.]|jgi:hypothetical protein
MDDLSPPRASIGSMLAAEAALARRRHSLGLGGLGSAIGAICSIPHCNVQPPLTVAAHHQAHRLSRGNRWLISSE